VTERIRRVWPALSWIIALNLLFPSPLWAIPSPDLVVNFFASAAQVLGLLTITLGGLAYSVSRRPGVAPRRMGPGWRWGLGVFLLDFLKGALPVLVAKLTTGELALDDLWFGGQTMNPWDLSMGSQGSSAGPGAATAAGLVGFSVGTETLGSILAPSGICGVTGLRPSFGRVSRHGVMALSWSLDKTGPMCRSVEDCALVLSAILGVDNHDLAVQDVPFNWDAGLDARKLRVGYLKAAFSDTRQTPQTDANDAAALQKLRSLGISLIEIKLPEHAGMPWQMVLNSEANSALKDPFRTHPAELVRQDRLVGLNAIRLLPAAEYLDALRLRTLLMQEMAQLMSDVDVYVVPFDYSDYTPNPVATINTAVNNLTGQPSVALPHGFNEKGDPTSLTFVGRVFGEAEMLAVAKLYQDATDWHLRHPKL